MSQSIVYTVIYSVLEKTGILPQVLFFERRMTNISMIRFEAPIMFTGKHKNWGSRSDVIVHILQDEYSRNSMSS